MPTPLSLCTNESPLYISPQIFKEINGNLSKSYRFQKNKRLKKNLEVDVLENDIKKYEDKINQLGQSET